jgi:hypothetical protein
VRFLLPLHYSADRGAESAGYPFLESTYNVAVVSCAATSRPSVEPTDEGTLLVFLGKGVDILNSPCLRTGLRLAPDETVLMISNIRYFCRHCLFNHGLNPPTIQEHSRHMRTTWPQAPCPLCAWLRRLPQSRMSSRESHHLSRSLHPRQPEHVALLFRHVLISEFSGVFDVYVSCWFSELAFQLIALAELCLRC